MAEAGNLDVIGMHLHSRFASQGSCSAHTKMLEIGTRWLQSSLVDASGRARRAPVGLRLDEIDGRRLACLGRIHIEPSPPAAQRLTRRARSAHRRLGGVGRLSTPSLRRPAPSPGVPRRRGIQRPPAPRAACRSARLMGCKGGDAAPRWGGHGAGGRASLGPGRASLRSWRATRRTRPAPGTVASPTCRAPPTCLRHALRAGAGSCECWLVRASAGSFARGAHHQSNPPYTCSSTRGTCEAQPSARCALLGAW